MVTSLATYYILLCFQDLHEEINVRNKNMTENTQHASDFSFLELITLYAAEKVNIQHILYFTAFLAFGIADGVTGAYMMESLGANAESNLIVRYLFTTQGFEGMMIAKIWFTVVILLAIHMVQLRSPDSMYWAVNGFLIALTAGGAMAANANLTAIAGGIPQAPGEIIFAYLALVLVLTEIGSMRDKHTAHIQNSSNGSGLNTQ